MTDPQPGKPAGAGGRYEIREQIGTGGSSTVYKAWDTQLHRFVAFKRLHPSDSLETSTIESMWKEAMTLAAIQHPNILTIFDSGVDADGPYVVTEFLDGETLDRYVRANPFTVRAFADAVAQTLEGLIAAHHADLIHRDLKHSNIMVVRLPSGALQYKILDFGLARFVSRPTSQTMHGNKSIYGTVYFLAPEQIRHDPLDVRTDLYAMGCVYYYMLSGKHAFDGEGFMDIITNHMEHRVKPLAEWRPDIPAAVCDWVMKLISSDPADRFVSAVEALTEFRRIDAQRTTHTTIKITPVMVGKPPAPPPPAAPAAPAVPPAAARRRRGLWLAAAGLVLVGLLAGLWVGYRKARDRAAARAWKASVTLPSGARAEVDYFAEVERPALLRAYFEQIKDLDYNYATIGHVGEALALVQLRRQYPPPEFECLSSLQYEDGKGQPAGEMDVVVFKRETRQAMMVYEVKISDNLEDARKKGLSQLKRFREYVKARNISRFVYAPDQSRMFKPEQFDGIQSFGTVGSKGAREQGFDVELDLSRTEAYQLQQALLQYRKKGK